MATQKILQIPSIRQSTLLSHLSFGEGSAVFVPVNSRFGYCGFIWACFPVEKYTDNAHDIFLSCCEWAEMILQKWLDEELSIPNQANHYVDLMERLKIPALIMLLPEKLLISNPSVEGMKEKEAFLNALRKESDQAEASGEHLS